METWRFRIVLCMALAVIIFGDFLGYGNAKAEKHHISRRASPNLREHKQQSKFFYGNFFFTYFSQPQLHIQFI